jgi:hypothetical protein
VIFPARIETTNIMFTHNFWFRYALRNKRSGLLNQQN